MSQRTSSPEISTTEPEREPEPEPEPQSTTRDPEALTEELEPVAYLFESWSDMSQSWEAGIRQSREAIPDDDMTVRNVTPLVTVSSVEAMLSVEQFRQERKQELGSD